jgi:hypothetical protein
MLVAISGLFILSGCTIYEVEPSDGLVQLPRLSTVEAAAVPEGARVEIVRCFPNSDPHPAISGVVLKASPAGLALANCTVQGTMQGVPILNKLPYTSRLYKTTGTLTERLPVLWVPLHQISSVHVVEPPPEGYVPPQIEIDTESMIPRGVDFDFNAETGGISTPSSDVDAQDDSRGGSANAGITGSLDATP